MLWLIVLRVTSAIFLTKYHINSDEYWQAVEVSYDMQYGNVDLPWEWKDEYRIRNTLYPRYLFCFLWLLNKLGADTAFMVRVYPYLAQSILVIIGDYYFYQVGKKTVGAPATRIAFLFYLTNQLYNEFIIRCFTNSVESIFFINAFYYFLEVKDKFNKTTAIMTALISLCFIMRSTSVVGWIPLLLLKIIYDNSFLAFLIAGFVVAIPILGLSILVDTLYFGKFTIAFWNFMQANLTEGLSKYFGVNPFQYYITDAMPNIFHVAYPLVFIGIWYHMKEKWNQKQSPYMAYSVVFYTLVFSAIEHKENRFLLPTIPLILLMIGQFLASKMKTYPVLVMLFTIICMIEQLISISHQALFESRQWEVMQYLQDKQFAPHSFYTFAKYWLSYYSWSHRHIYLNQNNQPFERTNLTLYRKDPSYARKKWGYPLQTLHDHDFNACIEMNYYIENEIMRPEYVMINKFDCGGQLYCWETCLDKFKSSGMYELEKKFQTGIQIDLQNFSYHTPEIFYLFRLKREFKPF